MKLKLSLPGDSNDESSPDAGKEDQEGSEKPAEEIKAGVYGIALKKALAADDGEAIEEALRACATA